MAEAIQWLIDKNKIIGKIQFVIIEKTSKTVLFSLLVFSIKSDNQIVSEKYYKTETIQRIFLSGNG